MRARMLIQKPSERSQCHEPYEAVAVHGNDTVGVTRMGVIDFLLALAQDMPFLAAMSNMPIWV